MKPIPGIDASNTGVARQDERLDLLWSLNDNHGMRCDLVINRNGRPGQYANTVGFVPYQYTYGIYSLPTC